jgi:hypothetical protein
MSNPGRAVEQRTVASVVTTNGSANITFPSNAIDARDVGRPISGAGIPVGATLATRSSATAGTLSANATASGTITATLGAPTPAVNGYGFVGWSPETDAEAATLQASAAGGAGVNDPARLTDPSTRVGQRSR